VALNDSPAYLQSLLARLQDFLNANRLKLFLKKCQIGPVKSGQRFLGQIVLPTHRLLAPENIREFSRRYVRMRAQTQRRKLTIFEFSQRVQSWLGHARQANTYRLRCAIFA